MRFHYLHDPKRQKWIYEKRRANSHHKHKHPTIKLSVFVRSTRRISFGNLKKSVAIRSTTSRRKKLKCSAHYSYTSSKIQFTAICVEPCGVCVCVQQFKRVQFVAVAERTTRTKRRPADPGPGENSIWPPENIIIKESEKNAWPERKCH